MVTRVALGAELEIIHKQSPGSQPYFRFAIISNNTEEVAVYCGMGALLHDAEAYGYPNNEWGYTVLPENWMDLRPSIGG
jgi:hypothetical protein